ncbi:MAG: hypothetical protein D3926_18735 [Desulfobacteraceae bacterium]|nr:MAG: hypothetical protein D3926_18735 [Desulfobacteraceae bacterium]
MPFKSIARGIAALMISLLILVMAAIIVLPSFITPRINDRISRQTGLHDFNSTLEKIGLNRLVFRQIRTGKNLFIDTLTLGYSPAGLYRDGQVDTVELSGVTVKISRDKDGRFRMDDLETLMGVDRGPAQETQGPIVLPRQIEIRHGILELAGRENTLHHLPFSAGIRPEVHDQDLEVAANGVILGQPFTCLLTRNLLTGISVLDVRSEHLNIGRLLHDLPVTIPQTVRTDPTDVRLILRNMKEAQVSMTRVRVHQPYPFEIQDIQASVSLLSGHVTSKGRFFVDALENQARLEYSLGVDTLDGEVSLDLLCPPIKNLKLPSSYSSGADSGSVPMEMVMSDAGFDLSVTGDTAQGAASLKVFSKQSRAVLQGNQVDAGECELTLYADYNTEKPGPFLKANVQASSRQVTVTTPTGNGSADALRIAGKCTLQSDLGYGGRFETWIDNGQAVLNQAPVQFKGITVYLPIKYPFEKTLDNGRVLADSCIYNNVDLGKIKTFLTQTPQGFDASGQVLFNHMPGINTRFDMAADLLSENSPGIDFKARVESFEFSQDMVKGFLPDSLKTLHFNGKAGASASVAFQNRQIKSGLDFKISNTRLEWPDKALVMEDINSKVAISDLLNLQSKPSQVLDIGRIQMNDFHLTDARLAFGIESPSSVLVEQMKVNWCNGQVSSEAFRVPDQNGQYLLTLHCDRLELSKLLDQVGAFKAQGSGTVNGRIPVSYNKGEISFDKGFLFSTPGTHGRILIENTDHLLDGIPQGTVQYNQLDLASEALKDYGYEWARLEFNSQKDLLHLNLQFDGQPTNPVLPFEFKQSVGSFVRVDSSSPGSKFQGIKLDVNVKIPFNQVLKFGNQFNQLIN